MRGLLIAVAVLGLTGCMAPTKYQPRAFTGGYQELQLNADSYLVSFYGNAYTNPSTVSDYLMLRCAELALSNGAPYFQIMGAADQTETRTFQQPSESVTTGQIQGVGSNTAYATLNTQTYGGGTTTQVKPGAAVRIKLLKASEEKAIDAALVAEQIRKRHGIKD
ncbi:MAG TPA: hypothetical protein VFM34_05140 [Moraxellaceae bacterium]|nr:hypothetical protein [Moraxellaceae bacterium]